MAVVLSNAELSVSRRSHPAARDAHGTPVPDTSPGTASAALPGAVREQADRGPWTLRLDPALWPVEQGDEVSDGTRTWIVDTALLHQVPGVPDVDYIAVTGSLEPPDVL